MTVSETEQDLVKKSRELTKLRAKRAEAVELLATIDAAIAKVSGEITALVSPVEPPKGSN